MQQSYNGLVKEKMLYNFIANNPMHLLGVPCNTTRKDILKTQERFLKMAKLGSSNISSEFTINAFTPARDIESLQKAVQQVSNIDYRLFWFSDSKYITDLNNRKDATLLNSTSIKKYDDFLAIVYSQFYNTENVLITYWEYILNYISDFRSNYPCFEDLFYFEERFREIENDSIPVYGRDIYARLYEIIEMPIIVFVSQINDIDILIKIIEIINRKNKASYFQKIVDSIYEQFRRIAERNIEEFSSILSKYLDSDYEYSEKDYANICVIFEKYHHKIKTLIDYLSKFEDFPTYTLERLKTSFVTNHVKISRNSNHQSKYKIFSKVMTYLGDQSTIALAKDLTFLKREFTLYKKGESKVASIKKQGSLRKDDLVVLENREDIILTIALKAYGDDPVSQRILGNLYGYEEQEFRTKYKVPLNANIAFEWWLKAAKQNDSDAQFAVAMAYLEGKGVYQDRRESINWLKKAASNGHQEAYNLVIKHRLY
jgi:hypothetical protein